MIYGLYLLELFSMPALFYLHLYLLMCCYVCDLCVRNDSFISIEYINHFTDFLNKRDYHFTDFLTKHAGMVQYRASTDAGSIGPVLAWYWLIMACVWGRVHLNMHRWYCSLEGPQPASFV